ncbi:hypothetical protein CGRA01v4_11233 [Colletotrichum graminicola]|uniref:Uncharacterized protein n=1 Tax=Colletotrichum graminicola (strain M1.001 / M2 / FGSC 10212) TaxID=645133 RepID=E3QNB6_COLGM|nr:uncharacterized protein GLRG_07498 [Colletotrichum graminicola M1.001]EFQ32354.1 hypothetical protein GLRG_07498 [Colletotrichum graminicola M1.001]WDK19946.1 hypothetical protein CGRA01v4_11233 [Colletotrichum graminicola]
MASLTGFRAITHCPSRCCESAYPHTTGCSLDVVHGCKNSLVCEADITPTARLHILGPLHDTMVLLFSRYNSCEDSMRFAQSAAAAVAMSGGGVDSDAVYSASSLLFSAYTQPGAACLDFYAAMCIIFSTFRIVPAFTLPPHGVPAYGSF